jgi:L-threonylcarbamoyladenylate synthase
VAGVTEATGSDAMLDRAVEALRAGKVVAIPTDTVYGLAVDPSRPAATPALFALKDRPPDLEVPVLVADLDQADALAAGGLPPLARRLAEGFWPGPLTIVVRRRADIDWALGTGGTTIGLRCPLHDVALRLCATVGPLATTSANRHGAPPKMTAAEVAAEFGDGVAVVVDGEAGGGVASTVVDATGETVTLLRAGAIDFGEIQALIGA